MVMLINPKNQVSLTEANQNFSKVAKLVDEKKSVIILKQNKPKYLVIDYDEITKIEEPSQNELEELSKKLMIKNLKAYKELAK